MRGIAISGRAGSGKSTLASILYDWLGGAGGARVCPVAEALKWEVLSAYGVTKADPGGRDRLISHGEARRLADPLHWIRKVDARCLGVAYSGKVPIVDDLRFSSELDWAKGFGMLTVRVMAPLAARRTRLASLGLDPDFACSAEAGESELAGRNDWDVIVWNAGADWLLRDARRVVRRFRRGA